MTKSSAAGAPRPWTPELVGYHQKRLGITKLGNLLSASRTVMRARLAGVEPDPAAIGQPGDLVLGAVMIARDLNQLFGIEG